MQLSDYLSLNGNSDLMGHTLSYFCLHSSKATSASGRTRIEGHFEVLPIL